MKAIPCVRSTDQADGQRAARQLRQPVDLCRLDTEQFLQRDVSIEILLRGVGEGLRRIHV